MIHLTKESLNEAARKTGFVDWEQAQCLCSAARLSTMQAHATTLDEFAAYKQEVSDAVEKLSATMLSPYVDELLGRFILPKPVDPMVEAWQMAFPGNHIEDARDKCAKISAAIEKRGGKIVWGEKQ